MIIIINMDLSFLLLSGTSLYIVGAVVCVVVVLLLVVFGKKSEQGSTSVASPVATTPSVTTESQSLAQEESILPSTTMAETSPLVIETLSSITPPIAVNKGEIPPLSSWKPSETVVPIKSEEVVVGSSETLQESVEQKPVV
ncbi:MAG: hypothetical protein KBC21_01975 [Candidatus Pacebacteria bacterium]|nr:hypothetical protein [Candidatus Paceibacterota bacterium]